MSASSFGNMRAPRVKAPLLLLLLLLLATLTRTVFCQDDEDVPKDPSGTVAQELESNTTDAVSSGEEEDADAVDKNGKIPILSRHGRLQTVNTTSEPVSTTNSEEAETTEASDPGSDPTEELDLIIIIIPVALVVLIIGMIVCGIFISRKCNKKKRNPEPSKEDPCLDGSSTEKVPMPMFEEDVPSVLELEMEELDQWMKKDDETTEDSKHL